MDEINFALLETLKICRDMQAEIESLYCENRELSARLKDAQREKLSPPQPINDRMVVMDLSGRFCGRCDHQEPVTCLLFSGGYLTWVGCHTHTQAALEEHEAARRLSKVTQKKRVGDMLFKMYSDVGAQDELCLMPDEDGGPPYYTFIPEAS